MAMTQAQPHALAPCPTWCRSAADGHPYSTAPSGGPQRRLHGITLGTWENGGRVIWVDVEAPAESTRPGVETVGAPTIRVETASFDGVDDLTVEQARSLAAFLAASLEVAASLVDRINDDLA